MNQKENKNKMFNLETYVSWSVCVRKFRKQISPSRQVVEKKAMFLVSRGFSWVHSGLLVWGSDSPVRDELSTWRHKKRKMSSSLVLWTDKLTYCRNLTLQPWEVMIRTSAGTRSPPLISTRSPTTSKLALISFFCPSLITRACYREEMV